MAEKDDVRAFVDGFKAIVGGEIARAVEAEVAKGRGRAEVEAEAMDALRHALARVIAENAATPTA